MLQILDMQICKYCDYIIEYDAERIRHVLIDHQTKCIYCENSLDYLNKTEHILEAHPQRCIHCTEYSIEYQTHMDQVNHMNAFHKQILTAFSSVGGNAEISLLMSM
jgi:hypothetical protein